MTWFEGAGVVDRGWELEIGGGMGEGLKMGVGAGDEGGVERGEGLLHITVITAHTVTIVSCDVISCFLCMNHINSTYIN